MTPASSPLVVIRAVGLSWVKGATDDPADLCAHAHVEVRIRGEIVVAATSEQVTVSAAALYLMRTLDRPHSKHAPVGDQLFPCCGFAMWDVPGSDDVVISGCPNGIDLDVAHEGGDVVVGAADGRKWRIALQDWREAVFAFADEVAAFYAASSRKVPAADDVPGWQKFGAEWKRRRGKPLV
jgi:hypothetical protein